MDRWERQVRDFPHACEWNCSICSQERIDALIGVVKYRDETDTVHYHIRYCRDNLECVDKAKTMDMMYGEKVFLVSEN